MKTDTDSVGYYRIRIWNRIEKINENRIRMYLLYYRIKFEYGYRYPYCCLNGYEYRISAIRFPSLSFLSPAHAWACMRTHTQAPSCRSTPRFDVASWTVGVTVPCGMQHGLAMRVRASTTRKIV